MIFEVGAEESPCSFPTLVSHTCARWRKVALDKSSLWSFIDFSDYPPFQRTALWLQRSRKSLLSIHLSVDHLERGRSGFDPDAGQVRHALRMLHPELHRWGSLTACLPPEPLRELLKVCATYETPSYLHSLSLQCTENEAIDEYYQLFRGSTPRLRRVRLVQVPLLWNGPIFDSLTHLHLEGLEEEIAPSLQQVDNILKRCSQLEELTLDQAGIVLAEEPDDFSFSPIVLPKLQLTQWTQLERDMYVWLSKWILAPIAHTYIGWVGRDDPEFREAIDNLANRCPFPSMRRLRTQYAETCTPVLVRMLSVMTQLVEVSFSFKCVVMFYNLTSHTRSKCFSARSALMP